MTKLEAWFRRNNCLCFHAGDEQNVSKLKLGNVYRPQDRTRGDDCHNIYIDKGWIWLKKINSNKIETTVLTNGQLVTFIESDAPHKSTAYKGFSGIVEDAKEDSFVINGKSGTLVCCIGTVIVEINDMKYKVVLSKRK